MFPKYLLSLMQKLISKASKPENILATSILYSFLVSLSSSLFRLYLSVTKWCFPFLDSLSLVWSQPLDNDQYHNQLILMNEYQLYLTVSSYLPTSDLSDCMWCHLATSKYNCGNVVLFTIRFLKVAKFFNLIPLSLLSCYTLSLAGKYFIVLLWH